MRDALTVFRKEMRRFFTDIRMLAGLFLPGVLIFVLYTVLGNLSIMDIGSEPVVPSNTQLVVKYTDNYGTGDNPLIIDLLEPLILQDTESGNSLSLEAVAPDKVEAVKELIRSEEVHLLIVFSDNFEDRVTGPEDSRGNTISMFYNAESEASTYVYGLAGDLISTCYDRYVVNWDGDLFLDPNVAEGNYQVLGAFSFLVPMLTMALLFSITLSICPESIAGEKERGTMASLLLTPVSKGNIAMGKIMALTVTAVASGIISFAGLILSLPNLMGGIPLSSLFSPGTLVVLLLLVLSALILFVTLGTLVSSFARSVKEATSYLTPMTVVITLLGMLPMVMNFTNIGTAFIPILNIIAAMSHLITGAAMSLLIPYILITVGINLVVSGILILLISRFFGSERVMFSR